jgi:hypothetical protein
MLHQQLLLPGWALLLQVVQAAPRPLARQSPSFRLL